jgi:mono/diheme cytochrome c family protein
MIAFALLFLVFAAELSLQQPSAREMFHNRCAACHGEDARGTAQEPGVALNPRVAAQTADQLSSFLERGNPSAGMPSFAGYPQCPGLGTRL